MPRRRARVIKRSSERLRNIFVNYEDLAESDDESSVNPRAGTSTSHASSSNFPDSVTALVRALLFRDQTKEPFKKSEIIKLALKTNRIDNSLWVSAEKRLRNSFGLLIVPLRDDHDGLNIITKQIPSQIHISSPHLNTSLHDGILTVVLGMIFMSCGSMDEASLMSALTDLNINENTPIDLPGNKTALFKDLLNSIWKKQMYIEIKEPRNLRKMFKWGQRADVEVSKPDILNLMAKIMKSRPEQWREQYRAAYGEDVDRFTHVSTDFPSRPARISQTTSSQSRSATEIISIDDDSNDDVNGNDDDEVQFVFETQPSRTRNRSPLKPWNVVQVKRERR